ncbi:MAG: DUF3769 domain-containing protein [Leptolyngbya sp. SIO4C1]|nr:DUF3769 domain-containing protein [Leptolyngbya sp. SIO4C1]
MAYFLLPPELPPAEIVQPQPAALVQPRLESASAANAQPTVKVPLPQRLITADLPALDSAVDPSPEPASANTPEPSPEPPEPELRDRAASDDRSDSESSNNESSGSELSGSELSDSESGDGSAVPLDLNEAVPAEGTAPTAPPRLEVTADYQDYDPVRQVLIARGNVQLQLGDTLLQADKLWVNLFNRYALAEGNVLLTRGEQIVQGQRAEYNFAQSAGTLFEAKGELFLPALGSDLSAPIEQPVTSRSVFDPLNPDRPIEGVTSAGGLQISAGTDTLPNTGGGLRRLRFEAERVVFDAEAWRAQNVRLTNDPFSPPELEFRSDEVTLVSISPEQDRLTASRARIVFDQGFSLPLLRSQILINRGTVDSDDINPFPTRVGIDNEDRGGLFVEASVPLSRDPRFQLEVMPQYLVSEAFENGALSSDAFGLGATLEATLGPQTRLRGNAELTRFKLNDLENNLRGNLQLQRPLGTHALFVDYSYRDRLYNGSLGFEDVRSSLGAVVVSPVIPLGDRNLTLNYQASAQYVTAEPSRRGPRADEELITLGRFQASARLAKGFLLWQGEPLPATATEGLRYTPQPIVPRVTLGTSLQGVGTYYTDGSIQELLAGDVRLDAQFGHLSRSFLDYTRFNIGYYRAFVGEDDSPFQFDRAVDRSILSFGLVQQVYGPLLLGFQTSINLDTSEAVNTEYIFEYSRRTYGLVVRYSPTRETGSIGFRLSDFSWLGRSDPFDSPRIRDVEGTVVEPQ